MRLLSIGVIVVCGLSASAYGRVVLSENFDELTDGPAVTSAGAFSTINGTNVDIVGPGFFPGLCVAPESGSCIDMNGSGGNPQGQLQSNKLFPAGVYLLSFDLIGSGRGSTASVTVTFGTYSQTFTLASSDVTSGIVVNQMVTLGSPSYLLFVSNTAGNVGLLLDNVVVKLVEAQVSYAANLAAGDSVINLTNTGSVNGFDPAGDICANVYVFAEDQQLIACCTCPLTPNHLKTLSAQNDLINNTLTPGVPIGITTMLVASSGPCNAANLGPLVDGLAAWGTTLHAAPGGGFGVTETAFQEVALSGSELVKLTTYCGFIQADGTTYGICGSCKAGAAGAAKQ